MRSRFLQHVIQLGLLPGQRALIAVSGGPDSMVLLHLLHETMAAHGLELIVAHVDHGIHRDSAAVAAQVEELAHAYGLRCITGSLALGGDATETAARAARYGWLEEVRVREGADYILTGHHADDQAETVLLRVLQGSGPAGLAAMQARSGRLIRPMLSFQRAEVLAYVRTHGLPVWDDPANADPRHLRSWLRSGILPLLRARLPEVDASLVLVAAQAAEDREAWDHILDLLPGLSWRAEEAGCSVAVPPLARYDSLLRRAVLRACGRRVGCRISREQARRAEDFLAGAESGSRMELGNGWRLEIVFDRAHLIRVAPSGSDAESSLVIEGDAGDGLVGRWSVSWRHEAAPAVQERDGLTAWFIPQALEVRTWEAGDKMFPLGGRGHRLVVRCLQDARVPRYQREGWPTVVTATGEIVWVPGVCRSNRLLPEPGAEALRVDAQVV